MSTCLPFRLSCQRNRPALRWTNLGARRDSQHGSRAAGQHSETDGFSARRGHLRFASRVVGSFRSASLRMVGFQTRRDLNDHNVEAGAGRVGHRRFGKPETDGFSARREPAELIAEGPWMERQGNYSASLVRRSDEKRIIWFVGRFV